MKILILLRFLVFFVLAFSCSIDCVSAQNSNRFMGVGSCSSSNCHGSVSPRNSSSVLQNEYVTWQKKDKHSQAWSVLTGEDSRRIASHLGIAVPENDRLCLDCHATNIVADPSKKGEKYRIEDGVGCESCHGAAEAWLPSHTERGATHNENLKNGLSDIVNPEKRAKLCVSCHLGDESRSVLHRLIGAGHPRMSFELDTFSMIQPKHWQVDKDYLERKADYVPAQSWLIGQSVNAQNLLDLLASKERSHTGLWPELSMFYCYTCHHSLAESQWKTRDYAMKPGELRLNLSAIRILEVTLQVISPSLSEKLTSLRYDLEMRFPKGEATETLDSIKHLLRSEIGTLIASTDLSTQQNKAIVRALLKLGSEVGQPYEVAEQIAMGSSALLSQIFPNDDRFKNEINRLYQALGQPDKFSSEQFVYACRALLTVLDR